MTYQFQFRRYALPFRGPVRTAHGVWSEREGVIVRLEDEAGVAGYGEAAPIPGFGGESVEDIVEVCQDLGVGGEEARLDGIPEHVPCLRQALWAARQPKLALAGKYLAVAALLPAGRGAIEQVKEKGEAGFRTFKWKVGVADVADELAILDDLCAALPNEGKLRLDANGAWDRRRAERWLERCAERPVEFVEQPVGGRRTEDGGLTTEDRKEMDLLLGLAADFPTPIALDESLARDGDVERWLDAGWPGVFVLKLGLHGDVAGTLARLEKVRTRVVFSSALETAVGARAALRTIFAWHNATPLAPSFAKPTEGKHARGHAETNPPRALGFGVWPLFADTRFDGPRAAPFVRSEDVEQINAEGVWNALS